jgi:hypothetical protein
LAVKVPGGRRGQAVDWEVAEAEARIIRPE